MPKMVQPETARNVLWRDEILTETGQGEMRVFLKESDVHNELPHILLGGEDPCWGGGDWRGVPGVHCTALS